MRSRFTIADWDRLPEGFPAELIDGFLVKEPAPDLDHQRLVTTILVRLSQLVGAERALPAPVDVIVGEHDVYQPDLVVLREPPRPGATRTRAPLLAVEVLSAGTARRDRGIKRRRLLGSGVTEVWLVDRDARSIEVHDADGLRTASGSERLASRALPGFSLAPAALFRPQA